MQLAFGTYSPDNAVPQEIQLSSFMRNVWAEFVKNPDAGPPVSSWSRIGTSNTGDLFVFGAGGSDSGSSVSSHAVDGPCASMMDAAVKNLGLG